VPDVSSEVSGASNENFTKVKKKKKILLADVVAVP
jgi:orotate phosphoribosyltransferase-like protein